MNKTIMEYSTIHLYPKNYLEILFPVNRAKTICSIWFHVCVFKSVFRKFQRKLLGQLLGRLKTSHIVSVFHTHLKNLLYPFLNNEPHFDLCVIFSFLFLSVNIMETLLLPVITWCFPNLVELVKWKSTIYTRKY